MENIDSSLKSLGHKKAGEDPTRGGKELMGFKSVGIPGRIRQQRPQYSSGVAEHARGHLSLFFTHLDALVFNCLIPTSPPSSCHAGTDRIARSRLVHGSTIQTSI
ncbi:hypothetical protein J6590_013920 [Homalodisca vitripennis]|nr:hypothetical protein J6590_013920 [Homalodisca vitripennis]